MRKLFEEWYKSRFEWIDGMFLWEEEHYRDIIVNAVWIGFNAGHILASEKRDTSDS